MLALVNVLSVHERYAYDLFSWGDYEGAVGHFLVAETPVDHVLSLFPSLAPPEFVPPGGSLEGEQPFPMRGIHPFSFGQQQSWSDIVASLVVVLW